jgi:YD repeat-containing protein
VKHELLSRYNGSAAIGRGFLGNGRHLEGVQIMKLVESASRWGNLYRLRYHLDGRRISHDAAGDAFDAVKAGEYTRTMEQTPFGWRLTLETVNAGI